MRSTYVRPAVGLVAIALLLSGGCLWCRPAQTGGWLTSQKPAAGPRGDDVVVLQISVLEQPVGDSGLNGHLWAGIDEGAVPLGRRAVLDDNGFRVAVAAGHASDALDALLKSQRSNPRPFEHTTRAGTTKTVPLGGVRTECTFEVRTDGQPTAAEFADAQCAMAVTPSLAPDGRVMLAFAPQIEHGAAKLLAQNDHGDFVLHGRRPVERYSALEFEVTLSPQDFVVVGTWVERGPTLGHRCFVTTDGLRPVQRLLVVRASRVITPAEPDADATDAAAARSTAAPLAYQALTVRGTCDD